MSTRNQKSKETTAENEVFSDVPVTKPIVTRYSFQKTNKFSRDFNTITIQVELANIGENLWAVRNIFSQCLNRNGKWEYESMPSGRSPDFFKRCRFSLEEALKLASIRFEEDLKKEMGILAKLDAKASS